MTCVFPRPMSENARGGSAPDDERCKQITLDHFEEAFSKARKSVTAADVKKFETFQASMKAR